MKCPFCGREIEESKPNQRQKALKKKHKERLAAAKEAFREKLEKKGEK